MGKTPFSGRWWRFDGYEIRHWHIYPAPGAALETYDPWKEQPDGFNPYESLQELVRLWDFDDDDVAKAAVVKWCNRYGLLGLITHHFISANLAPRWLPLHMLGKQPKDRAPPLAPEQKTFLQTPTGWVQIRRQPPPLMWAEGGKGLRDLRKDRRRAYSDDRSLRGKVVDADRIPTGWPSPGAITATGQSEPFRRIDPNRTVWADFFPDVPAEDVGTYNYPPPYTEAFWHQYGEPLHLFINAARDLSENLATLARLGNAKRLTNEERNQRDWAMRDVSAICAGVLVLTATDTAYSHQWAGRSLLATLGLMAVQELSANRLRRCKVCGRLFSSEAYQVEYCSKRCRQRQQKRAYRKRLKEKALKAEERSRKGKLARRSRANRKEHD